MLKFILGFSVGVVTGALVHKFITKEIMANDLRNETEQIRAYYKKKFDAQKKVEKEEKKEEDTQEKKELYRSYSSLSSMYSNSDDKEDVAYDKYSKEEKGPVENPISDESYWISPEQYDSESHYEKEELIYYVPNTLLTDYDDVVIDIDSSIGFDCLNEDKVFNGFTHARNDILKRVYKIAVKETSFLDYYQE